MAHVQNVVYTSGLPQTTAIQQQPVNRELKYANVYKNIGIAEISLGMLSIILGIVNIAIAPPYYYYGTANIAAGIWCGSLVLVAGILGCRSGIAPNQCLIISSMVVTIFAALSSVAMVSIEAIGCASHYASGHSENQTSTFAIHIILTIIGGIQLFVSIVHSSYCCAGSCSCSCCTSEAGQSQTTALPAQVLYVPAGQQHHFAAPPQYVVQGQPNQAFVSHQQPPSSSLVYPASQVQWSQVNTQQPLQYLVNDKV